MHTFTRARAQKLKKKEGNGAVLAGIQEEHLSPKAKFPTPGICGSQWG